MLVLNVRTQMCKMHIIIYDYSGDIENHFVDDENIHGFITIACLFVCFVCVLFSCMK